MSMDSAVGDYAQADVLVEGKKIVAVGPDLHVPDAAEIDARGRIVMPGFIDTHHHLFETALRSYLADGLLMDGLDPATSNNYFQRILLGFAPVYRPKDIYISTLFGSLSSLDAGVTTVCDISQIHHSPEHSDASLQALRDSDRRAVFGYFESAGGVAGNQYPTDARRIRKQHFSSNDQLLSMVMGGEIYLPGFEAAWSIGRELGLPVAAHIVGTFGMRPTFDTLASTNQFGPDNLFIHMTNMSDLAWQKARDAGAAISLSVPIEMNMRHGTPPVSGPRHR
jgi:cytosine/adenosine deaminase-related metal-dependent hydrolase